MNKLKEMMKTVKTSIEDGHMVIINLRLAKDVSEYFKDNTIIYNNIIFTDRVINGAIAIVSKYDKEEVIDEAIRLNTLCMAGQEADIHKNRNMN